jgi:hypothetical protein
MVNSGSEPDAERRRDAVRQIRVGVLLLLGAWAVASFSGWLTSAASDAASGGGGGVRVISLPLVLLGVLQLGRGLLEYSRLGGAPGDRDEDRP